jgi:UDP-N-acetylglucosamine--N-acetylmuramyl-(pentapeptide) pyrophosphoryl-undecaprenol N-acetylglucosamine transferase
MTRVIISGGGTGGHVFPAIAIANSLKKLEPSINILFIGAKGRMEMEKVPQAGYPIEVLWISGLQRKLTTQNLLFPVKVISSLVKASRIINTFKPDVVIGVGGYASGPTLKAAARKGIPILIQEQNSYPGITNKLLAAKALAICVAYEGLERFFPKEKIILTGNPVRQDFLSLEEKRNEAISIFHLDKEKTTLFATGGSLGAGTINKSIRKAILEKILEKGIQIIWQTGKFYFDAISADPELKNREGLIIMPFIERMDLAYSAADIVISRAGAIAISELCVVGRPAILIPSPNVAEDHQTKNAEALVKREAALMVKDVEAEEKLAGVLLRLIDSKELRLKLKTNISFMGKSDAADRIAAEALKLIKKQG